jgi:hypothetical protein
MRQDVAALVCTKTRNEGARSSRKPLRLRAWEHMYGQTCTYTRVTTEKKNERAAQTLFLVVIFVCCCLVCSLFFFLFFCLFLLRIV